jgi:Leucine-rich repeat (LRR) protein
MAVPVVQNAQSWSQDTSKLELPYDGAICHFLDAYLKHEQFRIVPADQDSADAHAITLHVGPVEFYIDSPDTLTDIYETIDVLLGGDRQSSHPLLALLNQLGDKGRLAIERELPYKALCYGVVEQVSMMAIVNEVTTLGTDIQSIFKRLKKVSLETVRDLLEFKRVEQSRVAGLDSWVKGGGELRLEAEESLRALDLEDFPEDLTPFKEICLEYLQRAEGLIERVLAARPTVLKLKSLDLSGVGVPGDLKGVKRLNLSFSTKVPNELLERALADGVEELELAHCRLNDIAIPESLKLTRLNLVGARGVSGALIERALASGLEELDIRGCDLSNVEIPKGLKNLKKLTLDGDQQRDWVNLALSCGVESLHVSRVDISSLTVPKELHGLKCLTLRRVRNITPEFVECILRSGIETVTFYDCELPDGIVVPKELRGLRRLTLTNTTNIPADLISGALAVPVKELAINIKEINMGHDSDDEATSLIGGIELPDNIVVPESLVGLEVLNLNGAINVPAELLSRVFAAKPAVVKLRMCDLSGVKVPKDLTGLKRLFLNNATHIPAGLVECAAESGVEVLYLPYCELGHMRPLTKVPRFKRLILHNMGLEIFNVPAHFITSALEARTAYLDLQGCDLTGVEVPADLVGMEVLRLRDASNLPKGLLPLALSSPLKYLRFGLNGRSDSVVPNGLIHVEELDIKDAQPIPDDLMTLALRSPIAKLRTGRLRFREVTVKREEVRPYYTDVVAYSMPDVLGEYYNLPVSLDLYTHRSYLPLDDEVAHASAAAGTFSSPAQLAVENEEVAEASAASNAQSRRRSPGYMAGSSAKRFRTQ